MPGLHPGAILRAAVREATIQVPGVPNALAARLAERHGFAAVYFSGAALSAGVLALPDVGLFTLNELVQQVHYVCRSTQLPVIVDADTGFGDVEQVREAIERLEEAGVAAIQLEDQQLPKRCGHLAGKELVESAVMCEKLQAAVDARRNPDLVLVARTDARSVEGFEQAVARAQQYLAAGADWIFPEALLSSAEFAAFADALSAPLVANMTEFGQSPLLTSDELATLGYACILYPVTLLRMAMKAMEMALAVIGDEGTQQELLDLMQTREQLYDLLQYNPPED
ncbi:MAG: methylisocitrate lyase [Planctomycetales bacterium]|nr:methylisocitrate lyase [Planctomycetales bacterium]NIM08318.1 methylisocitrate lyase [Planctomycetales bacterium]NIN07791.1 methylisocitrate lyase [Planctomycetales bacterium]NIN76922.1 methylisocitrate lyase [Planctomycetales bacterium]NIO34110.1 methylisocitrate lyase [Planctomycetales bacterium]